MYMKYLNKHILRYLNIKFKLKITNYIELHVIITKQNSTPIFLYSIPIYLVTRKVWIKAHTYLVPTVNYMILSNIG